MLMRSQALGSLSIATRELSLSDAVRGRKWTLPWLSPRLFTVSLVDEVQSATRQEMADRISIIVK